MSCDVDAAAEPNVAVSLRVVDEAFERGDRTGTAGEPN
jgi:hypothetical protein